MFCRVVFGTLLGPEATGPGGFSFPGFVCFWFPGAADRTRFGFLCWGLVCGVWCMGLLFENYIVDASIFYKKQFPRIMNLDLSVDRWCPFGVWLVCGMFCGSLVK